jgi:hypothetical protein
MNTILFLTGQTMGDACGSAGRALRTEFEELGFEYIEVNFTRPGANELLNRLIQEKRIELAYSFVGMCADLQATTSDGKETNLWEGLRVPFVSLYGDTPAYFFDRHVAPGSGFAFLYGFPEHYEFRKRLPGIRGLLGTLPAVAVDTIPRNALNFATKERGTLVFLKNGNDPEELLSMWRSNLSDLTFLMLMDIAGHLATNMQTSVGNDIDSLVCGYFRDKGLDIAALTNLRLFFVAQLDDYYRRLKSTLIAEALLDFPIEVHGFNWNHVNFSGKRARLIPTADYNVSRSLMKDALGVIDMSPNTGTTPHDRVRRAFGSYTLCLSNEQECFERVFPMQDQFCFRFDKESLRSRVADVLANPKRYVELGIHLSEVYRKSNVPNATAQCILDAASAVRLDTSFRFPDLQNYFGWPSTKV